MRNPDRINSVLQKLNIIWSQDKLNQLRLGQVLIVLAAKHNIKEDQLFNIEDEVWEEIFERYVNNYL